MSLLPLQATFCPQQSYVVERHLVSNTPSVTKTIVGFWLFYMRHQISDYTVHLVFINSTTNQIDYVSIGDIYTNSDFRYKIRVNISFTQKQKNTNNFFSSCQISRSQMFCSQQKAVLQCIHYINQQQMKCKRRTSSCTKNNRHKHVSVQKQHV